MSTEKEVLDAQREVASWPQSVKDATELSADFKDPDDEVEVEKAYVFYTAVDEEGDICVAMFLDTTAARGEDVRGSLAVKKLTGKFRKVTDEEALKVAQTFRIMELRARFNTYRGPYQVLTESELTTEELEQYLRSLSKDARKKFLSEAKV